MDIRRIALSGLTSAAVLAAGLCTAGTALASTTSQAPLPSPLTVSTPLMPGGPMGYVPALANALSAVPTTGPSGGSSPLSGVTSPLSGATGALGGGSSPLSGLTGGSSPLSGLTGSLGGGSSPLSGATSPLSGVMNDAGSATGQVPGLSGVTGVVPGLGQVTNLAGLGG